MSGLLQQEIFEAPPTRRLIVPEGFANYWGCDPSSRNAAIATISADGTRTVQTVAFPEMSGIPRLSYIYAAVKDAAMALAATCPAGLIFSEQTSGSKELINRELEHAAAATYLGLYDGVFEQTNRPPQLDLVVPGWWKKRACGKGDIFKPTRKRLGRKPEQIDYGVLVWARENGYDGWSWDECDAWGMAEAARREVLLEVRT